MEDKKIARPTLATSIEHTTTTDNSVTQNREYYKIDDIDNERYYMLPKSLFTDRYKNLGITAKVIYALLKDRMFLSKKNRWKETDNTIFLLFKQSSIANILRISERTCIRAMKELVKYNLIEVKRQGFGLPNKIYILKVVSDDEVTNLHVSNDNISRQYMTNYQTNDTDISDTEKSDTEKGGVGVASAADSSLLKEFEDAVSHKANNAEKAMLIALQNKYGDEMLSHAIKETALRAANTIKYTEAILNRWSKTNLAQPWLEKKKSNNASVKKSSNRENGEDAVMNLLKKYGYGG